MASNKTTNLKLDVWAEMDYFKRAELNANFEKLDQAVMNVDSSAKLGDLASLQSSVKDTVVNAINESISKISVLQRRVTTSVASMKSLSLSSGDYVKTLGYYSENDGGGAEYIVSNSSATDDGGSVIVLNNGLRANLIYGREVDVRQFGAKGDGVYDDTQAIKNAQQYAISKGIGILRFSKPSARYIVTDTITMDISKIRWVGSLVKIKYTGTADIPIIKMTAAGNGSPYTQKSDVLSGFEIYGTGKTIATGIHFEGTDESNSVAHIKVDANIHDVKYGMKFFSHTYLVEYAGDAWNCNTCAYIPSGGTNYGENIKLTGAYYNSDLLFQNDSQGGEFFVKGASLDYSPKIAVMNNGGKIHLDTCHVEFHTSTTTPIELNGDGACFVMVNGSFVTGGTTRPDYFIYCDAGNNGGAWFQNVYMGSLYTNTDYLANVVKGVVKISDPSFNTVSSMPRFISSRHNKLIDGGFEKTTIVDEIFVSSDTAAITNPLTGTNINLVTDSSQFRSGSRSLKVTKVGGSGTSAKFCLAIPTSQFKKPSFKLYYKKPGTGTGTVTITPAFAKIIYDSNGVAKLKNIQYQGSGTNISFTSTAVDWTVNQSDSTTISAPVWCSHYLVEVNMDWFTADSLFFDDVIISDM